MLFKMESILSIFSLGEDDTLQQSVITERPYTHRASMSEAIVIGYVD